MILAQTLLSINDKKAAKKQTVGNQTAGLFNIIIYLHPYQGGFT